EVLIVMKRSPVVVTTLLFLSILLFGCGSNTNSRADITGYVLQAEDGRVLVAENVSLEEFEDIKDQSISDLDGQNDVDLAYIRYDNRGIFEKGDEIEGWVDGIDESYPAQAAGVKISVKE